MIYTLQSAKLNSLMQKLAYQGIRNRGKHKPGQRPQTERNIKAAQEEAKRWFRNVPQEETIWKAMRCRDFSMSTCNFLWKVTHDAFKTGTQWLRQNYTEEYRARAHCWWDPHEIDSLDHI